MSKYRFLPESDVVGAEAGNSLCLNRIPYWIRYRLGEFTGAELKVWLAHLSHANKKTKKSFAGVKLLMKETGLSEQGIKLAHRGLVNKGWIKRYQTIDAKTKRRKTSTTFCQWPPTKPGTFWEQTEKGISERKERAECKDTVTN